MDEQPKVDSNLVSSTLGFQGGREAIELAVKKAPEIKTSPWVKNLKDIQREYPEMREWLIEGVLRRAEVCTLVAAAKEGKSHLAADLAQAVCMGSSWLGFNVKKGNVLLADNELGCATIAERNRQIFFARHGIMNQEFPYDGYDVAAVRGQEMDLIKMGEEIFEKCPRGHYNIVIVDALYKTYPEGFMENSNSDMTRLYGMFDKYAMMMDAAFVVVHHSSKEDQANKSTLQIGAGAGAITRAADTHLVLRPDPGGRPGTVIVESKARTFASIKPKEATYSYPIFTVTREIEPDEYAKMQPAPKDKKKEFQIEDLLKLFKGKPLSREELIFGSEAFNPKPPKSRVNSLIKLGVDQKKIMMIKSGKDERFEKMPEIVPDIEDAEIEPDCEVLLPPGEDA